MNLEQAMNLIDNFNSISVFDANGKYIYVNRKFTEFMHKTIDDLRGTYVWDVIPDTKVREVLKHRKPIIASPIKVNGIDSFCSYYPLYTKDGTFDGVMVSVVFSGIEAAMKFANIARDLEVELDRLKIQSNATAHYSINNIIGQSKAIIRLKDSIVAASRTPSTVLIEGETGTGKELVAHSIHNLSKRSNQNFVPVNCSAIPSNLMESEFFGYEAGAFTGAKKNGKPGKFELADHGTLFLDEIHQMPFDMQPKILRVLQEREVERIGALKAIPVDARIISATNVPLEQLVAEERFRQDLYYRLNVIRIKVPPLRERREDIPGIARNIVYKLNYTLGLDIPDIQPEVYEMMQHYDWPGNVRELQNMVESAMNRAYNEPLRAEHFETLQHLLHTQPQIHVSAPDLKTRTIDNEYQTILNALEQNHYNKQKTAAALGISRSTLYQKLNKYKDL